MKRVGLFSGTFDPVHRGHVEACVVALGVLSLDTVLLFIEKQPHQKSKIADFYDRANMLELAISDFPSLRMVDLEKDNITTSDTLKYLEKNFPGSEYWYIVGSDILERIKEWPDHSKLFQNINLCVVLRENGELLKIKDEIKKLQKQHKDTKFIILPSVWSPISSSKVKQSLKSGELTTAIDPAVKEYINRHLLYQ